MACPDCHHDDHGAAPCQTCAAAGTGTCWQRAIITGGDGVRTAESRIEMATGTEERPCCVCRSWEKDVQRLIRHFQSVGLTPEPDGSYTTPIARDFPGRKSLKIYPKNFGFCRLECRPTEDFATCPAWEPVRTASELQARIK